MVDLADGRVFAQQQPVKAAQLRDVAHQHHRAGHAAVVEKRDTSEEGDDVGTPLDLLGHRKHGGVGRSHRGFVHAEFVEAHPLGVRRDPQAVESADRVGAGVFDAGSGIEEEHAVTHARGFLGLGHVLAAERKVAPHNHPGEAVEGLDVDAFELSRTPADRRGRLSGEDGEHLPLPPHRDALDPSALSSGGDGDLALDDLTEAEGAGHEGPFGFVDHLADEVVSVEGLARRRPDLAEHDEPATRTARHRHEEKEIGETQVAQHPPRTHETLEVAERARLERGVQPGQFVEASHQIATDRGLRAVNAVSSV